MDATFLLRGSSNVLGQDGAVSGEVFEDRWAELGSEFVEGHYGSLRGAVRTHVIHEHLRSHLVAPPARIVDVGEGPATRAFHSPGLATT